MIEAAVIVLVAGFSIALGYGWGFKRGIAAAVEEAEAQLEPWITKRVLEEMLENPDTSRSAAQAVKDYIKGIEPRPLTHGFRVINKKIVEEN